MVIAKELLKRLLICSNLTNLEAMVARCFTFSGPDLPLDAHFAFGNF